MTTAEREHVREALFAHMQQHPVGEDALVRRMLHGGSSFDARPKVSPPLFRFAPVLAMVVLLAGAGGASFAAEGSVPGDLLYPVKIHVNESVRTVMLRHPEEKIAWEAERVERRMKEAEKLAARGALDAKKSAQLSTSVTKHSEALVTHIKDIETNNRLAASDARVDAAITLRTHDEVLSGIVAETMGTSSQDADSGNEADSIIEAIRKTSESLEAVEEAVETVAASAPVSDSEELAPITPPDEVIATANLRYEKAETSIAQARLLLSESRDALGELLGLQASRTLRLAGSALHAGEEDLEIGLYLAATEHFTEAQMLATRVQILIEANLELDVEVVIEDSSSEEALETEETEETEEVSETTTDTAVGGGADSVEDPEEPTGEDGADTAPAA